MFKLLLQHNYPNSKIQTNSIWYSWRRIAKCFFKIRRKGNQEYNFHDFRASKPRLGYMCSVDGLRQSRPPPRGNCPGRRPQAPACFKYIYIYYIYTHILFMCVYLTTLIKWRCLYKHLKRFLRISPWKTPCCKTEVLHHMKYASRPRQGGDKGLYVWGSGSGGSYSSHPHDSIEFAKGLAEIQVRKSWTYNELISTFVSL